MKGFSSVLFGTIARPASTFPKLVEDPRQNIHAGWLLAVLLGPWAIAVIIWVYLKAIPWVPTFIKIPDESYYFWEFVGALPVFLLPMVMVAGTIHLLSRFFTREKTMEEFLPPFLFALNVPFFLFAIHDIGYALICLSGVWTVEQFRSLITQPGLLMYINIFVGVGGFFWGLPLMALAIKAYYGLSLGKSWLLSLLCVPIFHIWVWVFFR